MIDNNLQKLNQLLARILSIPESSITDELSNDNVESWDSFTGLMMVAELEKEFSISFTMEEVLEIKTVGAIKEHLRKCGVVL